MKWILGAVMALAIAYSGCGEAETPAPEAAAAAPLELAVLTPSDGQAVGEVITVRGSVSDSTAQVEAEGIAMQVGPDGIFEGELRSTGAKGQTIRITATLGGVSTASVVTVDAITAQQRAQRKAERRQQRELARLEKAKRRAKRGAAKGPAPEQRQLAPEPSSGTSSDLSFTGSGGSSIGDVTVPVDSTVRWSCPGGGYFSLYDENFNTTISSNKDSGSSQIQAGTYSQIDVFGMCDWTIEIVPN